MIAMMMQPPQAPVSAPSIWPFLVIPLVFGVAFLFLLASRLGLHDLPFSARHNRSGQDLDRIREDPIVVLRERFAKGEIAIDDFKLRLEQLVATEPNMAKIEK